MVIGRTDHLHGGAAPKAGLRINGTLRRNRPYLPKYTGLEGSHSRRKAIDYLVLATKPQLVQDRFCLGRPESARKRVAGGRITCGLPRM
jgi:hypothetical protein